MHLACVMPKKMNVFSKSTLYVFSFTTLDQLDLQLQGFQYNLVESYLIWAFLKTTSRICPMKLGKKIFCIALCLGEVTILNGGSERSFLLTNFVVKKWHFVQNRFLLFFPPYFLFVFLTLIKMIILPTATHKFRDSFEWTRKRKAHKTKQNLWKVASFMYKHLLLWWRWLNRVFQCQYLPNLSINYVTINKDLEKIPPQLY